MCKSGSYKKGEKCLFLTNKDEFDSFFESVVSVGDERFVNFADLVNGFDFNLNFQAFFFVISKLIVSDYI